MPTFMLEGKFDDKGAVTGIQRLNLRSQSPLKAGDLLPLVARNLLSLLVRVHARQAKPDRALTSSLQGAIPRAPSGG